MFRSECLEKLIMVHSQGT